METRTENISIEIKDFLELFCYQTRQLEVCQKNVYRIKHKGTRRVFF